MDSQSARDLVKASRAPLGPVGKIVLSQYVEAAREQAQATMLYWEVAPMQPTWRCMNTDGRGRCRGRVSEAAVVQLCTRHQFIRVGDNNVEAILLTRRDMPGLFSRARLGRE